MLRKVDGRAGTLSRALGSHERWEEERGKAAQGSWRWAGEGF